MRSSKTVIFAALCLLLAALLSAGCFKGQANLAVHEDGSCTFKSTLLGADFIRQAIDENKDELLKNDPNAKIREITEGDKKGFEVISEFPDMKTLAEKGGKLFARQDGKCLGIMEKKTWFYDAYSFDLWVGSSQEEPTAEVDPQAQAMMQGFLSQIQYEFRLPSSPKATMRRRWRRKAKRSTGISRPRWRPSRKSISRPNTASGTRCTSP